MRIFGLIGLLVALVIVGLLAKRQFASMGAADLPDLPIVQGAQAPVTGSGTLNAREQSQQVQQQYKRDIDAAMQTRRPMPDDN